MDNKRIVKFYRLTSHLSFRHFHSISISDPLYIYIYTLLAEYDFRIYSSSKLNTIAIARISPNIHPRGSTYLRIHRLIIDRLISPEFSCHEALRRVYRVTFRLVGIRPPTPPTPRCIPARDARQRAWTAHARGWKFYARPRNYPTPDDLSLIINTPALETLARGKFFH